MREDSTKNTSRGKPEAVSKHQGKGTFNRGQGPSASTKQQSSRSTRKNESMGQGVGEEDILHAIVIVGEREVEMSFLPTTRHLPASLLPLCNIPLLDYTLGLLLHNGFQHVILYCIDSFNSVSDHITHSYWGSQTRMKIESIELKDTPVSLGTEEVKPADSINSSLAPERSTLTVANALRDVYDNERLGSASDFLLLFGETVGNLDLKRLIELHRKRIQSDRCAMTIPLSVCAPRHPLHTATCEKVAFAYDTNTQQLRKYAVEAHQTLQSKSHGNSAGPIQQVLKWAAGAGGTSVRRDVQRAHVYVCDASVIVAFKDNFDFNSLDDFIAHGLAHEETTGSKIMLEFIHIEKEYIARVSNFALFDVVSRDVMCRWTYPFVLDVGLMDPRSLFSCSLDNHYLDKSGGHLIERDVRLGHNVVLGSRVVLGQFASVSNSVVGAGTTIGKRSSLTNGCYIGQRVRIGKCCSLTHCFLANGVEVGDNVNIEADCVIGPNVIIPSCSNILKGTRIISSQNDLLFNVPEHPNFGSTAFEFSGMDFSHALPSDPSMLVPLLPGLLVEALVEEDRALLARIAASLAGKLCLWTTNVSQVATLRRAEEDPSDEEESGDETEEEVPGERAINLDDDDVLDDGDLVPGLANPNSESTASGDQAPTLVSSSSQGALPAENEPQIYSAKFILEQIKTAQQLFDELIATLNRAYDEKIIPENLIIEINSLKHAYGLGIRYLDALLIRAVLDFARSISLPPEANTSCQQPSRRAGGRAKLRFKLEREAAEKVDPVKFRQNLSTLLTTWSFVLKNYMQKEEAQLICLRIIEEASREDRRLYTDLVLNHLLNALYQSDIIKEATILQWAQEPATAPETRNALTPFLTFLQQPDDDDDEEEEAE